METIFALQSVKKVIGVEETPHTCLLARTLAPSQEDATLVLACCQTDPARVAGEPLPAGEGGVYFTLILKPQPVLDTAQLSLALSNAVGDALEKIFELKTKLLPQEGVAVWDKPARSYKKIADISAEKTEDGTYLLSAVIALNNRLPAPLGKTWTTLKKIIGSETSKELFLDAVLDNFWKEYAFL